MNYYIQDICCVCLSISDEKCSNKSATYVDNLTPLEKITTVFSELSSVMESDDRICTKCSDTVGFVYEFHKTCLKNINIFSSYKRILKENQPKKQCGLLVDLNESKKLKKVTLTSEEVKVEPPESTLDNDYIFLDANFVTLSHSSGVADLNNETCDGQLETTRQDSQIKIEYEQTDSKNEPMNEISNFESLKSNSKDLENVSAQSIEEMTNKEVENRKLIDDHFLEVAEEKPNDGREHLESLHVNQNVNSDSHMVNHSKRKKNYQLNIHTGEKTPKCDICGKVFSQMSCLKIHQVIHTGEKPHKCDICGKLFTQMSSLKSHQLIHTGEKPYKCEICGKSFRQMSNLSMHKITHTDKKPYKCDICGHLFSHKSNLNKHQLIHTGEKPHKCEICGKSFRQMSNLSMHKVIHTDEKPYKCDICGMLFSHKSNFNKHNSIHTGGKPHKSEICENSFNQKLSEENTLVPEEIKIEPPESPLNNDDISLNADFVPESGAVEIKQEIDVNYVTCDGEPEALQLGYDQTDFENVSVQSTKKMVNEEEEEENQELFEDPLWGVAEAKSDEGREHFEFIGINHSNSFEGKSIHVDQKLDSGSHTVLDSKKKKYIVRMGDKPFKCDICGILFSQMNHLTTHKLVHTNEKSYKCDICEKTFTHIDQLNTHQLVHTDDKLHKCDICGKSFTLVGNLSKHMLIHTGEKPYKCDICGKLFRQFGNLSKHKLIHTGEKPYKCDICGKLFTLIGNLTKHMLIHTGEKPFECDICQRSFNQMCSLKRHKLVHIGEQT